MDEASEPLFARAIDDGVRAISFRFFGCVDAHAAYLEDGRTDGRLASDVNADAVWAFRRCKRWNDRSFTRFVSSRVDGTTNDDDDARERPIDGWAGEANERVEREGCGLRLYG